LDEAVTLVRPALDKSGLTIETILEPGLPDVKVDARRMRQSIVNVLSNAIKFTPAPGRIRVEIRRGQNGALLIKIGDTGVGIDRDDLADVTKPFVQGRNADARSLKGVGLGLSIAEQLLQLHGGTLWITSTAGVGTMVTMQLPADRAVERRAAAAG
jgi:signal transduction histidine kinase